MVAQTALDRLVLVRIQVPQRTKRSKRPALSVFAEGQVPGALNGNKEAETDGPYPVETGVPGIFPDLI